MKSHERILELHSLLSKLLDSLCFELTINKNDDNCLSLLEILHWRQKGDISDDELLELYRSWLDSKSVFDLFSAKQIQIFPKNVLIESELAQKAFMNIGQINKSLQLLNEIYNRLYLEKRPANEYFLNETERIFSFLDPQGFIHLRLSSVLFLSAAMTITDKYTIPNTYEAYRVYFNETRKELSQVGGMVPLRGFKNYFLGLPPAKRNSLFQNLMPILLEFAKSYSGELPNLIEDAFNKWRNFPRFSTADGRKNLEIYKRVFEENEKEFYDDKATVEHFLKKYGEEFVDCFDIDSNLLRQFNILLKDSLNRCIQLFIRIGHSYGNSKPTHHGGQHKKKQASQLHHPKLSHRQSLRDKTPTKSSSKKIQFKNRTPTKRVYQNDFEVRREFGSADKSKSKTSYQARQTTPTKSFRGPSGLYMSQANASTKTPIKSGIEKDSFYNRMFFFRNKRVESYEIVMKRLRGK